MTSKVTKTRKQNKNTNKSAINKTSKNTNANMNDNMISEQEKPTVSADVFNNMRNRLLMDATIRTDYYVNKRKYPALYDYITNLIHAGYIMPVDTTYYQHCFNQLLSGINYLIFKHDDVNTDEYNNAFSKYEIDGVVVSFSSYSKNPFKTYDSLVRTANISRIILGYVLIQLINEYNLTVKNDDVNNYDSITDVNVNNNAFTSLMMKYALNDVKQGFDVQYAVQDSILFKDRVIQAGIEQEKIDKERAETMKNSKNADNSNSDDGNNVNNNSHNTTTTNNDMLSDNSAYADIMSSIASII